MRSTVLLSRVGVLGAAAVFALFTVVVAARPAGADFNGIVTPQTWQQLATDSRVNLDSRTKYYAVHGANPRQLQASMGVQGPLAIGSKNAIGRFRAGGGVTYRLLDRGSTCELFDFTVNESDLTWLPRWTGDGMATARTRGWWSKTAEDVRQHEQEHAFIRLIEVRALPSLLDRIPIFPTCAQVTDAVKRVTNEHWRLAERRSFAFDRWTDNGRNGRYWLG